MKVTLDKIQLTNFKNYPQQTVECSPQLNCLVGRNGMGKTNFLDAIYYLCMTKSHFSVPDTNIICHGENFFRLEGHFQTDIPLHIVAKYQLRKRKVFECNRIPYDKLSEHVGCLPVVLIAPDDTQLATEGSETRRKFMDNTLSQIDQQYLNRLILYTKLLKQRNALLKKMAEEKSWKPSLLEVYDQQMAPPAKFILEKRKDFARLLTPVFQIMHKYICQEQESVQLDYHSPVLEKDFITALRENREKDRILQRTTTGIHRDDLVFRIEEHPLKRFASQGQLKSYILALKLSQFEILRKNKEYTPILLLDDIFDKLDQGRVTQLLELIIQGNFGQVFVTDTHPDRVSNIARQFGPEQIQFTVDRGNIRAN